MLITNNCNNCNISKYKQIKYNNNTLLELLEQIKEYTNINNYNKKINNIDTNINSIKLIYLKFPSFIWNRIHLFLDIKNLYEMFINYTLLKLLQSLKSYKKIYLKQLKNWNNPIFELYCNKCNYKINSITNCNYCYNLNHINKNGMCYDCFNDIYYSNIIL